LLFNLLAQRYERRSTVNAGMKVPQYTGAKMHQ
jgi:hypothetical protein